MFNKIKNFFIYAYYYINGIIDAHIFMQRWFKDHKELVKMKREEGLTKFEIIQTYGMDAIQARFYFSDEQISQLKQSQ